MGQQPVLEYFYELKLNIEQTSTCTTFDDSCKVAGEENFKSTSIGFTNEDIVKCSIKFNFKDVTVSKSAQTNPESVKTTVNGIDYVANYDEDGGFFIVQNFQSSKNLFKIEVADTSIKVTVVNDAKAADFRDLQNEDLKLDFKVYAFLDSGIADLEGTPGQRED